MLVSIIQTQYSDKSFSADMADNEEEIDMLPQRGVWLSKKGEGVTLGEKMRYFTLMFGMESRMLKLAYYAAFKNGQQTERKGFIPVTRLSNLTLKGVNFNIVSVF